ncbi:MAG: AI-2E family transporter [Proteobacteria bacterium]|nr:AI-2E family transporter [Pseudomonadota bacterium]
MIDFDIKNKNQIYRLVAGISGFSVIFISCLIIMAPFFPAILLATILTLATWPAFSWLNRKLRNRTTLAASLMTTLMACLFIFPLVIIGTSITDNFTKVYSAVQDSLQNRTEDTARKLHSVPYIGKYLEKSWVVVAADKGHLSTMLEEYAAPTSQKLIALAGIVGRGLLDVSLGVLISYFFFRHGPRVAVRLGNLIDKFGGSRGQHLLQVSKNTLIGVVYGSNLPLLLVLLGVLGGMLAFGFIGIFLGPTILAVAYSLMIEWSSVRKKT